MIFTRRFYHIRIFPVVHLLGILYYTHVLFTSVQFLLFLPLAFALYWGLCGKSACAQNFGLIIFGYVFYAWWDWRFLGLLFFITLLAYLYGIVESHHACFPRLRFFVAVFAVLGVLAVFKYYDFFITQAASLLSLCGFQSHPHVLRLILPLGISFYTFQALGYVIDVRKGTVSAERNPLVFFASISFFPQLIAGPIARAQEQLPQFRSLRVFDNALAVEGCRQMLWGFFKKMVVADTCASFADSILMNPGSSGAALWVGALCFTLQIYFDFSGYSNIAIGCARLFGIRLMRNFNLPYFAQNMPDFWRRWHISLMTWFRDYIYFPLGGSRCSKTRHLLNVFAVFGVSGLWHGANWTFILWGFFHACCFVPRCLFLPAKSAPNVSSGHAAPMRWCLGPITRSLLVFFLALIGWTLFRAPDLATAGTWFAHMFTFAPGEVSFCVASKALRHVLPWAVLVFGVEWFNRNDEWECQRWPSRVWLRWFLYAALTWTIMIAQGANQSFVYAQF